MVLIFIVSSSSSTELSQSVNKSSNKQILKYTYNKYLFSPVYTPHKFVF